MKRRFLVHTIALALIVSACGAPAVVPTIDPLNVQSTAVAAASTYISQTQAAIPTITAIPASETPTSTPLPTDTQVSTATLDVTLTTPTSIVIPTDLPTFTPQPAAGSGSDPCNKALLTWEGPTATFTVVNETKPQGKIILLMSVVTKTGECGWLNIYSTTFSGPAGTYSAGAFVEGKKDFKVFGAFGVQEGGWKIVVRNDSISALGGCYPHC